MNSGLGMSLSEWLIKSSQELFLLPNIQSLNKPWFKSYFNHLIPVWLKLFSFIRPHFPHLCHTGILKGQAARTQYVIYLVVVQSLNHIRLFATPWTAATRLFYPSRSPEFAQIHVFWAGDAIVLSNYLILCHCLLFLPSIFPSFRVFSNVSYLLSFISSFSYEVQSGEPPYPDIEDYSCSALHSPVHHTYRSEEPCYHSS